MLDTKLHGKHIKITFEAFDENNRGIGSRVVFISAKQVADITFPVVVREAEAAARKFWSDAVQMGFLD
jgi:hypothetical protein